MGAPNVTDEELLSKGDVDSFEVFYRRHFEHVLGIFARRTRNPETAADLTAETFAAALTARRRYRPGAAPASSWLFSIAFHKLADTQRRGYAEARARHRLAMQPIDLTDGDRERIERLGEVATARQLLDDLSPDQRAAIQAHVVDEVSYEEIAQSLHVSTGVVRQRVSRGLAAVRGRLGASR
jgi:RNA polymerase sigma factor (sigma-70 family)